MGIVFEEENRAKNLMEVAHKMMMAARTAPKARGIDNIVTATVYGDEIRQLSDKMIRIAEANGQLQGFLRDADNILAAEVIVLIGTRIKPIGLSYCSLCGNKDCDAKRDSPEQPCAFNTGDLGIAIGSALSVAMDYRADNRVMYTVGMAARELNILGEDVRIIYGIPLSCTSKNPFFDRTWPK